MAEQLDLLSYRYPPTYPQVPGHRRRATSRSAAESVASRAGTLRATALAIIRSGPLTADEVAARMGESILSIRPRVTELALMGAIVDSGARRENTSGRKAIVWKVKAAGTAIPAA